MRGQALYFLRVIDGHYNFNNVKLFRENTGIFLRVAWQTFNDREVAIYEGNCFKQISIISYREARTLNERRLHTMKKQAEKDKLTALYERLSHDDEKSNRRKAK